jgi:hypothetical protein
MGSWGGTIREYAEMWGVGEDEEEIQERLEELQWFITVVLGVSRWKKDRPLKSDAFLYVHYFTSEISSNDFEQSLHGHLGTFTPFNPAPPQTDS